MFEKLLAWRRSRSQSNLSKKKKNRSKEDLLEYGGTHARRPPASAPVQDGPGRENVFMRNAPARSSGGRVKAAPKSKRDSFRRHSMADPSRGSDPWAGEAWQQPPRDPEPRTPPHSLYGEPWQQAEPWTQYRPQPAYQQPPPPGYYGYPGSPTQNGYHGYPPPQKRVLLPIENTRTDFMTAVQQYHSERNQRPLVRTPRGQGQGHRTPEGLEDVDAGQPRMRSSVASTVDQRPAYSSQHSNHSTQHSTSGFNSSGVTSSKQSLESVRGSADSRAESRGLLSSEPALHRRSASLRVPRDRGDPRAAERTTSFNLRRSASLRQRGSRDEHPRAFSAENVQRALSPEPRMRELQPLRGSSKSAELLRSGSGSVLDTGSSENILDVAVEQLSIAPSLAELGKATPQGSGTALATPSTDRLASLTNTPSNQNLDNMPSNQIAGTPQGSSKFYLPLPDEFSGTDGNATSTPGSKPAPPGDHANNNLTPISSKDRVSSSSQSYHANGARNTHVTTTPNNHMTPVSRTSEYRVPKPEPRTNHVTPNSRANQEAPNSRPGQQQQHKNLVSSNDSEHISKPEPVRRRPSQDRVTSQERLTSRMIDKDGAAHAREKENIADLAPRARELGLVRDVTTGESYCRGKLLGKGGFAKCYEFREVRSSKMYACKVISKSRISKPHQKDKILREVELQRPLRHKHVVTFHSYLEDDANLYIVLELCSRKSLVHVLKQRKTVTEPEVRYFLTQLVHGTRYIHSQRIIHRDLKLGNMLLNSGMQIKIADFGLATRIEYEGEKKMTVCGTPNYIAPEVLQKKGHSFEADIWAMGCIMYAMLVGRPPFETTTLKETYVRITTNKYSVPGSVSSAAKALIQRFLSPEPAARPPLSDVLRELFFSSGYLPTSLPTSCCETLPKFTKSQLELSAHQEKNRTLHAPPASKSGVSSRIEVIQPLSEVIQPPPDVIHQRPDVITSAEPPRPAHRRHARRDAAPEDRVLTSRQPGQSEPRQSAQMDAGYSPRMQMDSGYAVRTPAQMDSGYSTRTTIQPVHSGSPGELFNAPPPEVVWVTKWVDYSNKYGFGFHLSDSSVGVLFNDHTRMLLSLDRRSVYYNDLSNKVYDFDVSDPPSDQRKKATLLQYFAHYMDEHLVHGGNVIADPFSRAARRSQAQGLFMKKWFRTDKAIVMYLNNGTLQVNFFDDHTKVILSPAAHDFVVTYINRHKQCSCHKLGHGVAQLTAEVRDRLCYARTMIGNIINFEGEAV